MASVAVRILGGVALLAGGARDLHAQRILGPGDDAFVLPRGTVRWTVGGRWGAVEERFGSDGESRPLGLALSTDTVDAAVLPSLVLPQSALATFLRNGNARASLGALSVDARRRSSSVPMALEVGVASRLALSVRVPVTFTHASPHVTVNATRGPATANFGRSARAGADTLAARANAAYTQLQAQLADLVARLNAYIASCGGPGVPACAPAVQLRAEATQAQSAITAMYGPAARYSPLAGSATEAAIGARLAELAARASQVTGTTVSITARGVGAQAPIGRGELVSLLAGPSSELRLDSLSERGRLRVGDVEVGMRFLVVDGFGADERRRLSPRGGALRIALSGNVRIPTGEAPSMDDPFDPGTGLGAWYVDGGVHADAALSPRAWLSASVRGGAGLETTRRARGTFGRLGIAPYDEGDATARWKPGAFMVAELSPRYALSEFFGVSAHYAFTAHQADEYTLTSSRIVLEAAPAGAGAAVVPSALPALARTANIREQRLGLGVTYSTVSAARRGRTRIPLELHFQHFESVTGRNVERESVERVELRVYTRLWGR